VRYRVVVLLWMIAVLCAGLPGNQALGFSPPAGLADSNSCLLSALPEAAQHENGRNLKRVHLLKILGLVSPAVVSGSVSVSVAGISRESLVTYCLDGVPVWVSRKPPHAPGDEPDEIADGFSLRDVPPGEHCLQAVSAMPDGDVLSSDVITLRVVRTMNDLFSKSLAAYALHPTVRQPLETILKHTSTEGAYLTQEDLHVRHQIAAMYLNFGIDLSLDYESDQSTVLTSLLPNNWASAESNTEVPLSMQFSLDAPFYHSIPKDWPRVRLPHGYLHIVQLNTNQGGDGIGYGIATAQPESSAVTITSMWHQQESTLKTIAFRIPSNWLRSLPWLEAGDRHMIFVDPNPGIFVSLYKTSVDAIGRPHALYASSPASFDSLGDHGGSTASWFSELPLLIQPGEATSNTGAIRHALGGPVSRPWAARTYPATSRDYAVMTSTNSCTGKGLTNTGLVPYGGIIQLDPALDLARLKLSRPALRILQAMQTYGYYVMDFGCADLDIYSAIPESEFDRYGGLYGGPRQIGVQAEISRVITTSNLYVVPPLTRRPD
jgi:hypothetical protein